MKFALSVRKWTLVFVAAAIALTISGCRSSQPASGNGNSFVVTSDAFKDGEQIPGKYTETDYSIPLSWENSPKGTKSFAVMIVDLHPVANMWVHWIVVNIPASVNRIPEGASLTDKLPEGSKELLNTSGQTGYGRPSPPSGSGNHEYKTIVYALDVESLDAPVYVTYDQFQELVKEHVLGTAEISGFLEN
ncbi:YbhB/YbcL family Raf kinase inhibitor-like protein [Cohnella caldifontis]|uniref:YbhB/YbcL family Raf kinase inhibitor-like protein n=1 Tax=Cohnella caldifontis TaxID=3027471 RepID=UPI0023EAE57E|nr:YbhB/YbcL family Raf kinase inhibitor-like protein [Cohnella sp. YIM B05605]